MFDGVVLYYEIPSLLEGGYICNAREQGNGHNPDGEPGMQYPFIMVLLGYLRYRSPA
jgi:hypothetical protein